MEVVGRPDAEATVLNFEIEPIFAFLNPYAGAIGEAVDGTDYICGACGVVIAERAERGNVINIVFRCSRCRSFNVLRGR